jgi:hypothetical protein
MFKALLASTAVASALAFAATAQQTTEPMAPETGTEAPADTMSPAEGTGTMAPAVPGAADATMAPDRNLTPVEVGEISADDLIGAPIQTRNFENIAEIDDVLVSPEGSVENVVATFGGFLGFGTNTVLLTMDEIEVMRDDAGNLVVMTDLTPEALEGRPDHEAAN